MSNLCGCRGFAGSSACILERGHEGDHSYGNYLEAVVREYMTEKESMRQQLASRDAEVAGLREQLEESMDNDRTAMLYLSEIKSAIGLLCRKVSKNFNNEV